jgi:UDPglucose 6-dehydrogenase
MNVSIIGAGYVGLVSGACFAEFGANVTCIDNNKERIEQLNGGIMPIYEPGLDELVSSNVSAERLFFTNNLSDSVENSDLVFIAVGTPARRGDGHADLKYVYAVADEIAGYLRENTVVVNKSTVPVGTAREVKRIIRKAKPRLNFHIASNPEFLREDSAIEDFMKPDRVVLGLENKYSEKILNELYKPLHLIKTPIFSTDLESAELIKYASNAFLATKISFINEISLLCEKTGADVHSVSKGMGLDKRIGNKFLQPGPGYGGSCFPKDTQALVRMAQEFEASSRIVEAVIEVNASQKARMISKIREAIGGSELDKKIGILGLTFKAETDDMRDAPSLSILPALLDKGATIFAHDPEGVEEAKKLLPQTIIYKNSIEETAKDVDALVLMTEWNQYREMDLVLLKEIMRGDVFVDLRNIFERKIMEDEGFKYFCIGR